MKNSLSKVTGVRKKGERNGGRSGFTSPHPLVHYGVVVPPCLQLLQQENVLLVLQSRQNVLLQVQLDGLGVLLVQLLGVVVGSALGAHVVANGVGVDVCLVFEEPPLNFLRGAGGGARGGETIREKSGEVDLG